MSIQSRQKLPEFSVPENINRRYKVMFKISPQTGAHFIGSHLMRTLAMTGTYANNHNMLSWLFISLNPAFSHISHHKKKLFCNNALISVHVSFILTQFITKRERDLNRIPVPAVPRSHWSHHRCIWFRSQREGKKKYWICRHTVSGIWRQREAKIHQWEWSAFYQPPLVSLMWSARQSRETSAGAAAGLLKGKTVNRAS